MTDPAAMPSELTPLEVKKLLDSGRSLVLLDVREADEVAFVRLAGAVHIPMGEIPGRLHELDPDAEMVVYCHHGIRSANVTAYLRQRDFAHVANLAGGIDAWALTVDPTLPRY
jgi:adenylyltransferase/sulfurtransferase